MSSIVKLTRSNRAGAIVSALLAVGLAGCASDEPITEADVARDHLTGKADSDELRLGTYALDGTVRTPRVGHFTDLVFSKYERSTTNNRDFDGIYTAKLITKATLTPVTRDMMGGFQIFVRPGGKRYIKLFEGYKDAGFYQYTYVTNSLLLSKVGTSQEMFLNLKSAPGGVKPISRSCTLKEIFDDNVFEEGLSLDEYPDVSLERAADTGNIDWSVGSAGYSTGDADGYQLTITEGPGTDLVLTVTNPDISYKFAITGKVGIISKAEPGEEFSDVAEVTCD